MAFLTIAASRRSWKERSEGVDHRELRLHDEQYEDK
jgi:hypothetical protein